MEQTLHALADPRRRDIIEMLRHGEQPVGELVQRLPIAQSGVSRHLRILKDAGLVASRADGQRRLYSLCPEPFEQLSDWLDRVRELWEHRLDKFERELERRKAKPKQDRRKR